MICRENIWKTVAERRGLLFQVKRDREMEGKGKLFWSCYLEILFLGAMSQADMLHVDLAIAARIFDCRESKERSCRINQNREYS